MTPTERARRSDALYYDTESVARRCLCDMIANRESDLEELRVENAKLRDERREYQATIDSLVDECADHKAENAKLRTFIGLKEACWKYVGWCDECPYNGVDDEHDDCNCPAQEKINSLARELGVEGTE